MFRAAPAFIGLGLTALWVVGLCTDANVWLVWTIGLAAMAAFATVGLVPEREGGLWAGICLALIGLVLMGVWLVGLGTDFPDGLAWWTFLGAAATLGVAVGAALQGFIDRVRTPPVI